MPRPAISIAMLPVKEPILNTSEDIAEHGCLRRSTGEVQIVIWAVLTLAHQTERSGYFRGIPLL